MKQIKVSAAEQSRHPNASAQPVSILTFTAHALCSGPHMLRLTVPHVRHPTTSRWYKAPGEQRFAGTVEGLMPLSTFVHVLFFFTFQAPASGVHSKLRVLYCVSRGSAWLRRLGINHQFPPHGVCVHSQYVLLCLASSRQRVLVLPSVISLLCTSQERRASRLVS